MNNTTPTPQESLQIIDQAIAQLTASREVHVRLQQAVNVLSEVVTEHESLQNNLKAAAESQKTPKK